MKIKFPSLAFPPSAMTRMAVRYAASKRQLVLWRWRILGLLVTSILLIVLGRLLYGLWADMPGFVVVDRAIVRTPLAGRLVSAPPLGAQVKAGDTIAELVNDVLASERVVAPSQRERARPYVEPRAQPTAQIAALTVLAQHRRRQHQTLRSLMAAGAATRAEVAGAEAQLAETEAQLRSLRQESASALAARAQAAAAPPQARIVEVGARMQSLKLRAPESGKVAQVFGRHGEWINENSEVIDIRPERPARIEVRVEPSRAKYATVGRWATVTFLDGRARRAWVREVRMGAQRLPGDSAGPSALRQYAIVAVLQPERPLPPSEQLHLLPVTVRFDLP